jgi:hypothetical protein
MSDPAVTVTDGRPVLSNVQTASPTGAPVIPPAAVPYALAGIGLLQVVEEEVSNPGPWDGPRVLRLAIRIGTYLTLGALPGLRKR